ncbi:MAG: TIGR03086 family metal-binding protein [Nocardioidaceae bacterium]
MSTDLAPAAQRMEELLIGVTDEQLTAATPCVDYTLGDIIDHVGGLAQAFTMAATKEESGSGAAKGPSGDAARLDGRWRTRIPEQVAVLAKAWENPDAWQGMTRVGGFLELPASVAGRVALNELVVHGWDIARASDQLYDCDEATLRTCLEVMTEMAEGAADGPGEAGTGEAGSGPFGPAVAVPDEAPLLDRVIGISGRDPAWRSR